LRKVQEANTTANTSLSGFLATFGDLGWGKAEGRGQKAEGRKKKTTKILAVQGLQNLYITILSSSWI
jgi:hypothetical protein